MAAVKVGREFQDQVIAAFLKGQQNFAPQIQVLTSEFAGILTEAAVASHATAATRVIKDMRTEIRQPLKLQVYDAELDLAQRTLDLTDEQLAALAASYGVRAAQVTAELAAALSTEMAIVASEIAAQQLSQAQGKALLKEVFSRAGILQTTQANPHAFETLMRTQVQLANSAGRWEADQDQGVQEILWGYRYVTVGDDRVRPAHAALEGIQLPKDDPRWRTLFPPNGFNCRCVAIKSFKDEPQRARIKAPRTTAVIDGKRIQVRPDPGFDFNPGVVIGRNLGPNPVKRTLAN